MEIETQPLIFTTRLYKYIKSSAVVSVIQACVELITNSDDAYKKQNHETYKILRRP